MRGHAGGLRGSSLCHPDAIDWSPSVAQWPALTFFFPRPKPPIVLTDHGLPVGIAESHNVELLHKCSPNAFDWKVISVTNMLKSTRLCH